MRRLGTRAVMAAATVALFGVACTDAPTNPQLTEDHRIDLKRGGGGGGNKDIAVDLSAFTGGLGSLHGPLPAAIQKTGNRLWMRLPKNGKPPANPPGLCVTLPTPDTTYSQDDLDDFIAGGGSIGGTTCYTNVTLHTRDHRPQGDGLFTQAVGAAITAGGKIQLTEITTAGDWRLIFDTGAGNPDTTEIGKGICVDHPDADTWTVSNGCMVDSVPVDDVIQLWRVTSVWTQVADFTMPFSFTAER